jgi:cation-transporting P-type ATPase I
VTGAAHSVVDDHDDAGAHQNGVQVTQRRGQQPDRAAEQRVLSETTQ